MIVKISGKIAEKGLHVFDGEPRSHAGVVIPRLWIVVADREKAHIYRKTIKGIERIADARKGHLKSQHEGVSSSGIVTHGHDARSEKRHHEDSAFIQKLTAWLDHAEKENVFDRLVLVAAPHTLGDIRALLTKNVHTRLVTEVDKDFIKLSDKEIENHLSKIIWF